MTELLTGVEAPSDAELISRVRGGDLAAYGELFTRHVEAARRLGRQLVRGPDVDDLVSDAFAKTLNVLQNGGGPDVAFRAYLLTSLRRLHVDKLRAGKKVQPEEDMTVFDDGVPFLDPAIASFDNSAAAKAFASLPERWQLVLWHLEVEGQKPADIAPLLGMTPNSVSALAYRAREGLRQAFLTMHLADTPTEQCRWVNQHLGAYVRKGLSKRDTAKVEDHLEGCRRCTAMYLELNEVNSNLAGIIAPLLLGAAAAGYLSSAGGAGATGVAALFGRVRDAVSGNGSAGGAGGAGAGGSTAAGGGAAATAGGLVTVGGIVAASVAAITAAAFILGGGTEREVLTEADRPVVVRTPAPGSADAEPGDRAGDRAGDAEPDTPGDSASEDAEAAEGDAVTSAEDQPGDSVPFTAVADGDGAGGTTDASVDSPAAPAGGSDVVAPPAAPADDTPAPPRDDAPASPGDDPTTPGTGDPAGEPGTDPGTGTDTPPAGEPPVDEQPPADGPGTDPTDDLPAPLPPTAPVGTALSVSALSVLDGTVSVSFDGAAVGSSVRLSLSSDPGGISISEGGDCVVDSTAPGTWLCSPNGATTSSFARVLATAVALQSTSAYTIDVPLYMPADQADRTEVTFTYLLDGEDAEPGTETVTLRIANVALSAVPDPVRATETAGRFLVEAGLSGIAAETSTMEYSITTPGARFVASASCSTEDGLRATCAVPGDGVQEFVLDVENQTVATDVTIVASPVPGFIDAYRENNFQVFTLPGVTSVTAGLNSTDPGRPDRILTVTITNAPEGAVRFELVAPDGGSLSASLALTAPESCSLEDDAAVSCEVPESGAGTWDLGINVPLGHLDVLLRATFADPGADPIDVPLILED